MGHKFLLYLKLTYKSDNIFLFISNYAEMLLRMSTSGLYTSISIVCVYCSINYTCTLTVDLIS